MDAPASAEIQIHWRIKAWFPDLGFETHSKLRSYFNELLKHNKTINLITSKTLVNCDLFHFADSINAAKIVQKKVKNNIDLYDIGSGNGFPGLVFAILFPEQKIVLNDSDDRRIDFLKAVVSSLGLPNVRVEHKKVELYDADVLEQVICRDFGTLSKTLMTLRKSVKLGGLVFNLKSDEWSKEVLQIPAQLCSSWRPHLIGEYKLPVNDIKLYVVEAIKI